MNVYVVFSKHPISVHINNLNSIKHDCILVLALGQQRPSRHWTLPEMLDTSDSETFCRQCGQLLGCLLETEYTSDNIRAIWKELMQEKN